MAKTTVPAKQPWPPKWMDSEPVQHEPEQQAEQLSGQAVRRKKKRRRSRPKIGKQPSRMAPVKKALSDWRSIEDDREKYQAYLCSHEWAKLKTAVHERAGGGCERCGLFKIGAVHHLTYVRKYAEELKDLAGWCLHCHNFTHDKHWFDPKFHETFVRFMYNFREFQRAGDSRQPAPIEAFEGRDRLRSDIKAVLNIVDESWEQLCALPNGVPELAVQKSMIMAGLQLPFMYLPVVRRLDLALGHLVDDSPYRKTTADQAQFIAGRFGFDVTSKPEWLLEAVGK